MLVERASAPSASDADLLAEEELLAGLTSGDRRAFETLMKRYNERLLRVARAITGDDGDAEDAVQAACLTAYVRVAQFAGRSSVGTWLTRIAINEARARRRARRYATDSLEEVADQVLDAHDSPETAALLQQQARRVEVAIGALAEPYRSVLVLTQVQGLTSEEAAAALGVTEEVVRVRLHRARATLRRQLGLEGGDAA